MIFFSKKQNGFYDSSIHGNKIPNDAVAITEEEHIELIQGQQENGKLIVSDSSGYPFLQDPPTLPVVERIELAKRAIDTAAGKARSRFVSSGDFIDQEYSQVDASVKAWRESGSPASDVPGDVQAWAAATGMTAEEAAADIEQTSANWRSLLTTIRHIRLAGKAAVDAADDEADFYAIAQTYIDQLSDMQP